MSDTLARLALSHLITHALTRNFPEVTNLLIQAMEGWGVPNKNLVKATPQDIELFERFWCKLFDKTASTDKMPRWACFATSIVHGATLGAAFARLAAAKCDDIVAAAQFVLSPEPLERASGRPAAAGPKPRFTIHKGGLS